MPWWWWLWESGSTGNCLNVSKDRKRSREGHHHEVFGARMLALKISRGRDAEWAFDCKSFARCNYTRHIEACDNTNSGDSGDFGDSLRPWVPISSGKWPPLNLSFVPTLITDPTRALLRKDPDWIGFEIGRRHIFSHILVILIQAFSQWLTNKFKQHPLSEREIGRGREEWIKKMVRWWAEVAQKWCWRWGGEAARQTLALIDSYIH